MSRYFDREGQEISIQRWCELHGDMSYRRIGHTQLSEGIVVSTVWLGLDHQFDPGGPPLVFETMIFRHGEEAGCWRYSTLDEARAGHEAAVARVTP